MILAGRTTGRVPSFSAELSRPDTSCRGLRTDALRSKRDPGAGPARLQLDNDLVIVTEPSHSVGSGHGSRQCRRRAVAGRRSSEPAVLLARSVPANARCRCWLLYAVAHVSLTDSDPQSRPFSIAGDGKR